MSNPAIILENISKRYRLGMVGSGTLREDIVGWWYQVRGKEDPYSKIAETNNREQKGASNYVWALKDINFSVEQGEVLGVIGKNGAGKSTLLKLLSRVTAPTTGTIKARGRIASLLEVGTGFHPELSGRDNIFLNGAIMGMRHGEIKRKLDEIVDFAGVERYIDTPVKRYSSGMYVRLAFAVAAHLEPEILIVDEVLAVGDAQFQKKAIGKMKDVSQGQGRTVLFVSHNLKSIVSLCGRCVLMKNGQVDLIGNPQDCIAEYTNYSEKKTIATLDNGSIINFQCDSSRPDELTPIYEGNAVRIKFSFEGINTLNHTRLSINLRRSDNLLLFNSLSPFFEIKRGQVVSLTAEIPKHLLISGSYHFDVILSQNEQVILYKAEFCAPFSVVVNKNEDSAWYGDTSKHVFKPAVVWS